MASAPPSAVKSSTADAITALFAVLASLARRPPDQPAHDRDLRGQRRAARRLPRRGRHARPRSVRSVASTSRRSSRTCSPARRPPPPTTAIAAARRSSRWCAEEGEVRESPMARMKPPRLPEAPAPASSRGQLRKLVETTEKDRSFVGDPRRRDPAAVPRHRDPTGRAPGRGACRRRPRRGPPQGDRQGQPDAVRAGRRHDRPGARSLPPPPCEASGRGLPCPVARPQGSTPRDGARQARARACGSRRARRASTRTCSVTHMRTRCSMPGCRRRTSWPWPAGGAGTWWLGMPAETRAQRAIKAARALSPGDRLEDGRR